MQRSNQCCAKKTMGKNTNKSNQAATRRRQRRRHDCPDALMSIASAMLLLIVAVAAVNAQMEQMSSSNLGSIATGSGRIFRPTRSTMMQEQAQEELTSETNADDAAAELAEQMTAALSKRSMSLGRLAYGPGKRRFLPVREEIWPRRSYASISGAFARDPLNRRYELLFMDNGGDDGQQTEQQQQQQLDIGAGVPQKNELNLKQQQFTKLANHPMRFRLLPSSSMVNAAEDIVLPENNEIFEASMGKRSSLASGRIGFRPAKRSMAVGRTGFRPGKRSIATGRVRFRPGKRAMPTITNPEEEVYYLWL